MGQTIQIRDTDVVDDVLLVSTDRSFTGQDGETYRPTDEIGADAIFPARLAARLFESDPSIDHVYVMSNVISARRKGGWDDSMVGSASETVAAFFRFYEAAPPGAAPVDSESAPSVEPETHPADEAQAETQAPAETES